MVPSYVGGAGSSVPIAFPVPYDTRETDARNRKDEIFWKLTAAAMLPGLDFHASFRVPVFKNEGSDASLTIEKCEAERLAGKQPPDPGITEELSAEGGVQFHLKRGRMKGVAGTALLVGLMFLAAGLTFGFVLGNAFTWILGIIPLGIGGVVGLGSLALGVWLWAGQTTVGVVNRVLRIHSSCLGFSRARIVEATAIQRFELVAGTRSDDKVWYDLQVHLANGRILTAGSGLKKAEAEWFLGELKRDLGTETRG